MTVENESLVCVQGRDRGEQRASQAQAQEISLLTAESVVCCCACWHACHHAPFIFQNDTASPLITDALCQRSTPGFLSCTGRARACIVHIHRTADTVSSSRGRAAIFLMLVIFR